MRVLLLFGAVDVEPSIQSNKYTDLENKHAPINKSVYYYETAAFLLLLLLLLFDAQQARKFRHQL